MALFLLVHGFARRPEVPPPPSGTTAPPPGWVAAGGCPRLCQLHQRDFHLRARGRTHTLAHTHARTHTLAHTHTHSHTHARMRSPPRGPFPGLHPRKPHPPRTQGPGRPPRPPELPLQGLAAGAAHSFRLNQTALGSSALPSIRLLSPGWARAGVSARLRPPSPAWGPPSPRTGRAAPGRLCPAGPLRSALPLLLGPRPLAARSSDAPAFPAWARRGAPQSQGLFTPLIALSWFIANLFAYLEPLQHW